MPLNIILPTKATYQLGQDFPFMSIPLDIDEYDPQSVTFDDFQWWCYTSAFKKWLKANPRSWVADSEDLESKYTGDFINEKISEYYSDKYREILEESFESDVLSVDEYLALNEEKGENDDSNVEKSLIKLHFAYNTLKQNGKILPLSVESDMPTGEEVAVFLSLKGEGDPEQSLVAYKMKAVAGNNKIKCVSVIESVPGGPVNEKSASALFEKILKYAVIAGAAGVGGFLAFGAIKIGAGAIGGSYILKSIRGLKQTDVVKSLKEVAEKATAKVSVTQEALDAAKAAKAANRTAKTAADLKEAQKAFNLAVREAKAAEQALEVQKRTGTFAKVKNVAGKGIKGIRGVGKAILDMATFATTRGAIKYGIEGAKTSLKMTKNVGNAASRGLSATKYFGRNFGRAVVGTGSKASGKTASRLIPFVGEVLLAIDMVGSAINWYSDKQAPTWGDIEKTVGDQGGYVFNPKGFGVGSQISICWKQPAGGALGTIGSFFYSNDTRTTADLIKIGETPDGTKSVFIILSVNSKEYQKQLATYAAVLLVIPNDDVNSGSLYRQLVDAEDMDAQLVMLKNPEDMAVPFTFMGFCKWNTFIDEYNNSEDQLIISDGRAPGDYNFYYKRPQGEYINVSGKILSSEDLGEKSSQEIIDAFALDGENKNEKPEKTNESIIPEVNKQSLNENEIIAHIVSNKGGNILQKFSDFESLYESVSSGRIFEEDADEDNTEEDKGQTYKLTTEQSMGPAQVAIYKIISCQYANPEDQQYQASPATHFVIDEAYYDTPDNDPIEVSMNSTDVVVDPRKGIYIFKEEKKEDETPEEDKEEEEKTNNTSPIVSDDEEEGKKDDYFITVDPDDVSIKNRKSSTVIRDKNFKGGLNIIDEFLTDRQKEILGIEDWNAITFAKAKMDRRGDVIEIKIRNKYAPFGRRTMKYVVSDGEQFEIAKKFASDIEDRIKYQ